MWRRRSNCIAWLPPENEMLREVSSVPVALFCPSLPARVTLMPRIAISFASSPQWLTPAATRRSRKKQFVGNGIARLASSDARRPKASGASAVSPLSKQAPKPHAFLCLNRYWPGITEARIGRKRFAWPAVSRSTGRG